MDVKSPKTIGVVRSKSLGNCCKAVSRAQHSPKALESFFVANLAAPETGDKQKTCKFGQFGPCRTHSIKFCRANPRSNERARALSFSVFQIKIPCGGGNRM